MPNTRTPKKWMTRFAARHQRSDVPPLLGRADVLDELFECAESSESAILIAGVTGSGRTSVLQELRDDAELRTVWVAPHPWERTRPFAGISLVLNAIEDKRVSRFLGGLSLAEPTFDGALSVAADLITLLRAADNEELLLLIDDADQFDESSQFVFAYLAARLSNTGLRMVLAVSPEAKFGVFEGIRSVWMSRLTREQSRELARSIAPDMDAQTLAMVCAACGGLPGMIASAISQLTSDQLDGNAPLALPLYPGSAGLAFEPWEPETLRLLQRLSTAPLCSLSALPGIRTIDRDRFEQLVSQGLVEIHGSFVSIHDGAMRSSLYWSMSSSQREELHSLAALEEAGHSRGLVQWHLDHGQDATSARDSLLDEAEQLCKQGLIGPAIEFVERTLLLNPVPEEMFRQLLALCERLTALSEFELARRYLRVCRRAAVKRKEQAECIRLDLTIATLADEPLDLGAVDVYAHRYRKDSPHASAELLAFAAISLADMGDIASARRKIDAAYEIEPASRVAAESAQSWARRLIDSIDGRGAGPTSKHSRDPEIDTLPASVRLVSGRALMAEERYDDARLTFRGLLLDTPRRKRGIAWTNRILALAAQNEIRAGNIPEASRIIESLSESSGNVRNLMLFAWNDAIVRGRSEAEHLIAEAQELVNDGHRPVLSARLLAFDGTLAIMRGDLDDARMRLARAYEPALEIRPDWIRMEGDFVEVLARRGEWDAARRVTTRFAERAKAHPSQWSDMVLARCEAIVATDDEVVAKFSSAVALAKKRSATIELGRTRMNFASALDRLGLGQRASDQRQAAEYAFESLAATGWVNAVRESARAIEKPLQTSLLSTLTDSELAVLRLMHKGVRNKDIATALFVSLRTVEVRITQIYRKLEARSRSHLLTLLPTELDQIDSL
jgi:DNA-binding CsgD family transcriptional regulator/tetratricopeptide (TPR) repeat protein